MARLIDADELLKRLQLDLDKTYLGEITATTEMSVGEICSLIKDCPAVDVELVQRGNIIWKERFVGGYKYKKTKCHNCGTTEQVEVEHPVKTKIGYCSECEKRLDDTFMKYCPNCGAKMGESDNE